MGTRRKSARASLVLTTGEAMVYGCSFIRNMILARMLTKADFGIAATLTMFITLLEFSSRLGISRFLVRDKEGNQPEFLAAAHLVHAVAAGLSSIVMAFAAWPLARLFGIGDHVSALLVLAVIPLLHGATHLDVRRFERELRFGPGVWLEMVPQVTITLAAWPLAMWLGDYRTMLVLLIVKAVFVCVGSHWVAERPFQLRMHRDYVTRMLHFGWPLMVNGFLMFGVLQGDQFLVATFYGMVELAPYAAAAALTMAPTFVFGRIFNPVALPVLAKAQGDPSAFERRYGLLIGIISVFSAAYCVGMIIGSEAIMRLVYGQKYAHSGIILCWLVAANSFRNIRIAPAIAAMARGDSMNQLLSSLARVVALAPALAVAYARQPVWMIASSGLVGEALACMVSFQRLSAVHRMPRARNLRPTGLVAAAVLLAGAISRLGTQYLHPVLSLSLAVLGAALAGGVVMLLLEDTRREAQRLWGLSRSVSLGEWLSLLKDNGPWRKSAQP